MNEEEKQAIKILKSYKNPFDLGNRTRYGKSIQLIENLIIKQQKEIETLKESQLVLYGDDGNIVGCIRLGNDVISKDKIKEKMRGEINKSWRNTEQRKCQLYAYDILKELLGE